MGKYKFTIEAYYTENGYLELDKNELKTLYIDNNSIKVDLINRNDETIGIKVESENYFLDIEECINIAKIVYSNFILALNNTDISFLLDKYNKGNFQEYCNNSDAEVYKEIIITDIEKNENKIYIDLYKGPLGCTHFKLNSIENVRIDAKLKNSLMINNYRKYLRNDKIKPYINDTLVSASIEALLENRNRPEGEIAVIDELDKYLKYMEQLTNNKNYGNVREMVVNNKHKSIRSRQRALIEKYSNKNETKENLILSKKISKNRTYEVHKGNNNKKFNIYDYSMLNKIQFGYAIDLYNFSKDINEVKEDKKNETKR